MTRNEIESGPEGRQERRLICRGLAASPGAGTGRVVLVTGPADGDKIARGDILVARSITPDMVSALRKAGAVVTDEGGRTCHAAILSRELGVPCIVGARTATELLKEGQTVLVDASRGAVYEASPEDVPPQKIPFAPPKDLPSEKASAPAASPFPSVVTATKIFLNLEGPASVERWAALPSDGVGLLRTEFIFSGRIGVHPMHLVRTNQGGLFIDKLAEGLAAVARAFEPRPVLMRFSDFRTDDFRRLQGERDGAGGKQPHDRVERGLPVCLPEYEEGFRLECRAVRKVREDFGRTNLSVIIPFVRTLGEMEAVRRIMASEGLVSGPSFKIWLMAEVPSVVLQADQFAALADGITIGSNDLTQLILGVDRDSALLGPWGISTNATPPSLRPSPADPGGEKRASLFHLRRRPLGLPRFRRTPRPGRGGQHQRQRRHPLSQGDRRLGGAEDHPRRNAQGVAPSAWRYPAKGRPGFIPASPSSSSLPLSS
ncbi:hypothetical protein MASR2M79_25200 [Aminivibrio sp.]